jgi:hypothetical protein
MAFSKTTVSRQAPRTYPTPAGSNRSQQNATGMEDVRQQEVEESPPQPAVSTPSRLTVNGIQVKRVMVEFGKDVACWSPNGDGNYNSVIERYWDQRDTGPENDKYSRPRAFCTAVIDINTNKGFLDVTVSWPGQPGISKLVQPGGSVNYEV